MTLRCYAYACYQLQISAVLQLLQHMMYTTFVVLVAALLINTLSCCSGENVYCVTPTATSCSSCPHNTHCATLSAYAHEAGLYFTSNTAMVFLPGDHTLDTNITVGNVARLTMRGESSSGNRATVICSGSVGLHFTSMVEFKIDSLSLTSCSRKHAVVYANHLTITQVALYLQSTQSAELVNCSFHDNLGTALRVDDTNITLAGNSEFTHNYMLCGGNLVGGGGIVAYSSILSFTGNTTFLDNTASCSVEGGAIYTLDSSVSFKGINNFMSNSAAGDGGVISTYDTTLNFSGTNNFIKNSAKHGGAICTKNTALSLSGTNSFIKNSAGHGGGAVYTLDNNLNFNGPNNLINNSAHWKGGTTSGLTFNGTNNFISNSAGRSGGAVFAKHTALTFTDSGTRNFINNSAQWNGGAIYTYDYTVLTFEGTNDFSSNSAAGDGGAISTYDTTLNFSGTNNFIKNSAKHGGAVCTKNTALSLSGTNSFIKNSAGHGGGAIYTVDNNLSFIGTKNFINNSAHWKGGAIYTLGSTVSFKGINNFISNSAGSNGGAIFTYDTILNFSGANNFIKNSAKHGGAVFTNDTVLYFCGTNSFIKNSARHYGGAVVTTDNTALTFIGTNNFISNSAGRNGGAAVIGYNTASSFSGNSNFINNSAYWDGGAINAHNTALSFNGTNIFINNTSNWIGGAIFTKDITLNFSGTSNFINNSASGGGAIGTDSNSSLTFNGTIYFTNNGHYWEGVTAGGGVYLGVKCIFSIFPNTTVYWENNCATLGGAIYVQDVSPLSYCTPLVQYIPKQQCFFQLPGQTLSNGIDVKLVFKNNSADVAGSVLYGGAIDHCKLTHGLDSYSSGEVFDMLVNNNDTDYNTNSNISNDPIQICLCENNLPNCSKHHVSHTAYPGETFQVSVVAVGQRNGTVTGTVINNIDRSINYLSDSQYLQETNNTCTKLKYTVFSLSQIVQMGLSAAHGPCIRYYRYTLVISVKLNQTCPPGFNISMSTQSCVCEPKLQRYTNSCRIINGLGQITRDSSRQFWVGYHNQFDELILHPYCPFDYCVNDTVVFPLNNTDTQCAYNRSGLLCGKCKESYSLVLGTSHCKQCTNSHLVLLIPFAVMGVALVFLLFVCKLTVAAGMLNGLVFYANIVVVHHTIFLPVESTDAFSIFIAWLNLDFGIETCFYNGMDAYSKTWLQFVFPVYIWSLVGLMILVSHFSRRFARLLGNNPVSVLATLILFSYTKILRTLITALYITYNVS